MVKKVLLGLVVVLLLLAAGIGIQHLQFKSKQLAIEAEPAPEISGVAVRHFQNAIHYRTISFWRQYPIGYGSVFWISSHSEQPTRVALYQPENMSGWVGTVCFILEEGTSSNFGTGCNDGTSGCSSY